MRRALMHECGDGPELPSPQLDEGSEIFDKGNEAEAEGSRRTTSPNCGDRARDGRSLCLLCDQERAAEIPIDLGELLMILLLCLPAFGQATYSGHSTRSGSVVYGSVLASGYLGYTGTEIIQWPGTVPDLGGALRNNATVYDTSYVPYGQPSGSLAPVTRCTDAAFFPSKPNTSGTAGLGGSGAAMAVNANSTLVHVNTGAGGDAITMFDPSTGTCGDPTTHVAITTDKNTAGGGDSAHYADFGGGGFGPSDPLRWDSFGGGPNSTATTVTPATFCFTGSASCPTGPANIQYTWATNPIADFYLGLPNLNNTADWAQNQSYSFGTFVKYTLTGSQIPAYQTTTAYVVGDLIVASDACAYKAFKITTGIAGGSATWHGAGGTNCNLNTVDDGGVTWKGIGSTSASFVYQLTAPSGGGTSCSSCTPAFATTCTGCQSQHADFVATVTDGSLTWTNVGVATVPAGIGWISWGGSSADETKFAEVTSTNSYGSTGNYAKWAGGQGSGSFALSYDLTAQTYHLWNSATGIMTDTVCSGGTGWNCSGGTWVRSTVGQLASDCMIVLHNEKMNTNGQYIVVVGQGSPLSGSSCTGSNFYVWRPLQTPFNSTTQVIVTGIGLNHWTVGTDYIAELNQSGYTSASGVYMTLLPLNNPNISGAFPACTAGTGNCPLIVWQASPCSTSPSGTPPVYNPPACTLGSVIDNHLSIVAGENSPICGSVYNYATLSPVAMNAWQGEEFCTSSNVRWTDTANPGAQAQYRFTHIFGSGTNDLFNSQFAISQYSPDGNWLFFTTDWNSQWGSTDGTTPTLGTNPSDSVAIAGATCYGGLPWQANTLYTPGTQGSMIHPIQGTSGGGTTYEVVEAISTTGDSMSSSTHPTWTTADPVGTKYFETHTGGSVTWEVVATQGNCRSDVAAVRLRR